MHSFMVSFYCIYLQPVGEALKYTISNAVNKHRVFTPAFSEAFDAFFKVVIYYTSQGLNDVNLQLEQAKTDLANSLKELTETKKELAERTKSLDEAELRLQIEVYTPLTTQQVKAVRDVWAIVMKGDPKTTGINMYMQ